MTGSAKTLREETAKVDFDPNVKREGVVYVADDGTIMRVDGGVGRPLEEKVKLSEKDKAWFKGYVHLRDLVQAARAAQINDGDWEGALKALNTAYDAFRQEHGPIRDFRVQVRKSTDEEGNIVETPIRIFKNRRLFREDYDSAIVTQLEAINEAGEIRKAAFMLGRTIGKPVVRQIKTVGDALAVSLDEIGRLDLDDIARRIKLTREEVIDALGNQVYRTPQGEWQLADEYLSGDVVAKLEEAMDAARVDKSLERNVEALKAVQPEKLGPSQIAVKLGADWVPVAYINEFAEEIGAGHVTFDAKTESWEVEGGNLRSERMAGAEYGTADRSPSELLEAALNSRPVTIKRRTEDKKEVTDTAATTAANEVIRKIRDKFKSWVWTDAERATDLVEIYNRRFNNIAPRRFDGSHLTLPGVSLRFKLHPHQLRAIWRQIQTGDTYLAHAVGSGKTIEMIAGGMEQKRLGLIKKPMYVVPNHMLEQFANEFMELYPLANIMVADDENFSAERRKAFVAAATLNAPDAIIITHSAFERIGLKEESVAPIRDAILSDLEIELAEAGKRDRVRRSQLQQQIEAVTQRFDSIIGASKKDSTVTFEDIGADMLFVDEAHAYRKLDFTTNQKIKGIDPNGSRRALDMYVKTRYLQRKRPGRAMVFASGTPVTNTMGELYTVMRFFAPDELERDGIATFDGWSRQFGEVVPALEANAAGRYEVVERFAKFDNVPELMSRVRQFMDVLTSEQLGALVKRPEIEGGKPNLVTVEATPALKEYMKTRLLPRLEASRNWKPSKDEPFNPDPVISITTDGRFAALDPRFFGATVDDNTPTKLHAMADAIVAEYKATANNVYTDTETGTDDPLKGGTQIVFYNLGFGEQSQKNRGFNARAALTKRLVDGGVQRDHILWFDDADTDAKKEAMFKAMRSGQARILIGSAKKMGTGVNVQKRLTMLHYFDPPWYPSDVEQPLGRIIRQGNQNERVRINWYATKDTYDATMWQMVARKQRFIDQAFTGDKSLRSMDDMSEASMFEQAAAVASGDPRALQLAGLRQDVERLERLQAAHHNEQVNVRHALRNAEWDVNLDHDRIRIYGAAFKALGERYVSFATGKVGRAVFDKMSEFGQALKDAFNQKAADHAMDPKPDPIDLGEVNGIALKMHPDFEREGKPTGNFELVAHIGPYQADVVTAATMGADVDAVGLARRIVNTLNGVETKLNQAKRDLASHETDVTRLRKKLGAPFEYTQELAEKYGELKRLEEELKAEGEAEAAAAAAPASPVIREDGSAEGEPPADPAVFSRAGTVGHGVPMRDARAVIATIRKALPKAPPIHLHEKVSQAPRALVAQIRAIGAERTVHAAFHEGEIHVFPGNIGSIEDMQFIVGHHEIRHYGMRAMLGPRLGPVMLDIYNSNAQVRAAADAKIAAGLAGSRVEAVEEALADMPVDKVAGVRGFGRLAAMLRSWLRTIAGKFRALGLTRLADSIEPEKWSDSDVARFILKAEDISRTGGEQFRTGGTVFDRAPAADATGSDEAKRDPFNVKGATGNTLAHYRGMAMQALGRRQIVDLWAKDLPQLAVYNDLVQRMDADKNDAGAEADSIATAWGKLKDERALAELMHDATLAQIDPAKDYSIGDSRPEYDALRSRYNALSDEAKAIYKQARDSYAAHYAAVKDAIRARLERSMISSDRRRALLEKMEEDFFKAKKGVYFPLARFGKYVVLVRDADGKVVSVSRAETINEADTVRTRLLADYPAAKGFKVGKVLKDKEFNARLYGPGKGFMDELFEVLEAGNASADLQDAVSQLYLASLPDLSWAKHGIHRKGTPGFSQDARRAFAQNMFHGARYLAKLRYADRLQDQLMQMQEHVNERAEDEDFDSVKAQQVVDEMVKRHETLMNPQTNPISTALTSVGFVFHLGLSPASALVNLLQTPMVAYPIMGAKWGYDKAASALMKASREAAANKNDISRALNGDERAAYDEAVRAGVIDVTMAHDLAGIASGEDSKVTWKLRPVMKWASFLFHHAEKFNRQVTFMAAYRLAREAGATHAEAYEQAADATYKGHFDYSASNRPRLMAGNWAKVLLLFKQFGQNMVYTLSRQAYLATKGATQAERKEARKALGGLLVTHAMGAGALGMPMVGTLLAAASWLGGSDDEPWDAEAALQNMLADALGTKAAEVLAHGLSRLTPWDISGRVGLNQMILPDIREGLEGRDLWEEIAVSALGPVAAIAGGALDGMQQISRGRVATGLEAMLPAVLRAPVRAYRYGTEGAVDRTGITIVDEVSAAGVAGQVLGLSPSEVRHATEGRSAIYRADKALVDRRSTLMAMYAKAQMANDADGLADVREQIASFNEKHPGRRITPQNLRASIAARRRRIAQAEQGIYLPFNRRDAMEAGRFAATIE
jgi:N12 class adenine-specific DNA methylase